MRLDESASRRHGGAHKHVKRPICRCRIFDRNLEQDPIGGVHRRIPKLLRVHLAQALVARE